MSVFLHPQYPGAGWQVETRVSESTNGGVFLFFAKAVIGYQMKIPHWEIKVCSLIGYKLYRNLCHKVR